MFAFHFLSLYTRINSNVGKDCSGRNWRSCRSLYLFIRQIYRINCVVYNCKLVLGTSKILPLDRYPRFCLIHLDNHSQVAFYPRFNNALAEGDDFQGHVSGMLNVEEILSFVDDYLKHGNDFTVESEHF